MRRRTNVGVDGYNVYRDGVLVTSESNTNHTAVGLTPAKSYDFQVSALDVAGSESAASGSLDVTTDPGPEPPIHVGGIAMELQTIGRWISARAVISIVGSVPVDDGGQWVRPDGGGTDGDGVGPRSGQ